MEIIHGDCLDVMREMEPESVDAVVTDPPAAIAFMGKAWDSDRGGRTQWVAWMTEVMDECFRLLKPGGHAFVWALPRTSHWTATAIEDAGFDVRDIVTHHFGSGFPKSLSVSKAIDKAAGVDREDKFEGVFARRAGPTGNKKCDQCGKWLVSGTPCQCPRPQDASVTPEAQQWDGWGTALKPASEHWILARKPLIGTVASTVLTHGTGALNIDGCRTETEPRSTGTVNLHATSGVHGVYGSDNRRDRQQRYDTHKPAGRWPANIVFTHSLDCGDDCAPDCPVAELDRQSGSSKTPIKVTRGAGGKHAGRYAPIREQHDIPSYGDSGGASRFFPVFRYEAKASRKDRGDGNSHPTVKPTVLMQWLVRLITPPGGVVLDPFCGSASTLVAALREGFDAIGIEREAEYVDIARKRLGSIQPTLELTA